MNAARPPVALVGIGCRFPGGVDSPASFWRLLVEEREAIGPMPPGRFDAHRLYDPQPRTPGRVVTPDGGFLSDIDRFDAAFFGISPREAKKIDPQQRLLLEVAWEALEDAGIPPSSLAGTRTGVFVGLWSGEYEHVLARRLEEMDLYATTGGGRYAASGRISFAFDLRGPSLTVDTACSSSLVAVHLACRALRSGECDVVIAGAANLILQPFVSVAYSRAGMLSPGARCRFGAPGPDGYVRSEGVAAVVLKRLDDAVRDGDPIYAAILGSAVNSDGRANEIFVAPGEAAQVAMLRSAYDDAGVSLADVAYVEAHGTGTAAGDKVELSALGSVLGAGRRTPLRVGSVKRLIGHTEAASGLAGLIKAALSLDRGEVPGGGHGTARNPEIPWAELGVEVVTGPTPLRGEQPAIIGVNSFGVTGTNAHVVLRAVPARPARPPVLPGPWPVVVSGRSPAARLEAARRLAAYLDSNPDTRPADLAYTTLRRRDHHAFRLGVVAQTVEEFRQALRAYVESNAAPGGAPLPAVAEGEAGAERPKVGFVFSGPGSQWTGMGRELLQVAPAFAETIRAADAALAPHVEWRLLDVLERNQPSLDRVDVAEPVLGGIQIALARQLEAWGVRPDGVVGHGMGEVAAAHLAGILSIESAMRILAVRGRLLAEVAGRGAMALVELGEAVVREHLHALGGRASIAAVNGPRSVVVAGEPDAVDVLLAELSQQDVVCHRLKGDVAPHSTQVEPLLSRLESALAGLPVTAPSCGFYSTLLADPLGRDAPDAAYWSRNLRRTIQFARAIRRMAEDGITIFVEVSPHPILLSALADIAGGAGRPLRAVPLLRCGEPDRARLIEAIVRLHVHGVAVDGSALVDPGARVLRLPPYPWQRESYWLDDWDDWSEDAGAAGDRPTRPDTADTSAWEVVWRPASGAPEPAPVEGRWLILSDSGGVGEWLAVSLAAAGAEPIVIPFRAAYARPDEHSLQPLPAEVEDALRRASGELRGIVALWALDSCTTGGARRLEEDLARGCGTSLWLARLIRDRGIRPGSIWWITRGAQPVGDRSVAPTSVAQSAVWGMARSLGRDHPEYDVHLVDLDPGASATDAAACVFRSIRELSAEAQIGFDGKAPFAARLVQAGPDAIPRAASWRRDATYLITGGLGGIARSIAGEMIRGGASRFLLVSRTPLPPRREWAVAELNTDERARVETVLELERQGASVHVLTVDVGDEAALAAALAGFAAERWPPIRGVVHLAGEIDHSPTWDALRRTASGKALGAWNLFRLLPDLEQVVLFSSALAAVPQAVHGNYAAANALLDGLASAWRAGGTHAVSLGWGPWLGVGMARGAAFERFLQVMGENGVKPMTPEAARRLFRWVAATPRSHLVLASIDWGVARLRVAGKPGASFYAEVIGSQSREAPSSAMREQLVALRPEPRRRALVRRVRKLAAAVLELPEEALSETRPLGRQGLDSLTAMQLRSRLEVELGLTIPASAIWNHPTPEALAAYLAAMLEESTGMGDDVAHAPPATTEPQPRAAAEDSAPLSVVPPAGAEVAARAETAVAEPAEVAAAATLIERVATRDDADVLAELRGVSK